MAKLRRSLRRWSRRSSLADENLGVDHGLKRVGLAISDETGTVAQSIGYVGANIAEVIRVATERNAGKVCGWLARRLDGTASEQTERNAGGLLQRWNAQPNCR